MRPVAAPLYTIDEKRLDVLSGDFLPTQTASVGFIWSLDDCFMYKTHLFTPLEIYS
jgi:hypothetical protein